MTENQYKVVQDNLGEYSVLRPDNSIVCTELQYKATAELFCDELNELNNENEQLKRADNLCECETEIMKLKEEFKELKSKVDDKEVAVEVETEKLMNKVFDLIEEKIKHAQEYYADERADRSYYHGQLSILRELKKELKE